jgi:hypothetical protein
MTITDRWPALDDIVGDPFGYDCDDPDNPAWGDCAWGQPDGDDDPPF